MKTQINSVQLFTLANVLGACTLDGAPAELQPSANGKLALVRATDGSKAMLFNWSTAQRVIQLRGGRFLTVRDR